MLDPELYSKESLPLNSVKDFISKKLPQLGWGQTQEEDVILDIGCGPGGTTLQLILPLFSKAKKIVATDMLPKMIGFAQAYNSHPLIEYSVADIENWSTVEQWKGHISKCIAIHSFQWLKDKRVGFQNMFELLKPGGEAAFCFVMESTLYASIQALESCPKWSECFKSVDDCVSNDHINKNKLSHYIKMLEEIGFNILHLEEEVKSDPFSSDAEFRNFFASVCALTSHVPIDQREEFKDDLFQEMLRQNGRDGDGRAIHRAQIIEGVVRK